MEDGIEAAATGGTLSAVAVSGSYTDLINQPTIPSIAGLASTSYVDAAVADLASESYVDDAITTALATFASSIGSTVLDALPGLVQRVRYDDVTGWPDNARYTDPERSPEFVGGTDADPPPETSGPENSATWVEPQA
jgi:hypothetical protein